MKTWSVNKHKPDFSDMLAKAPYVGQVANMDHRVLPKPAHDELRTR